MKNSIQYFTEKGIPELEKIKINFMETPAMFDKCVKEVLQVLLRFACCLICEWLEECNTLLECSAKRRGRWHVKDHARKSILTPIGSITFTRTRFINKETKKTAYLLDKILGWEPHTRLSDGTRAGILEAAAQCSYEKAGESACHGEDRVSRQTVMRQVRGMEVPPEGREETSEKRKVKYLYVEADEDHIALQYKEKKGDIKRYRGHADNGQIVKLVYVHEGYVESGENPKRKELKNVVYFGGLYRGKDNEKLWREVKEYIERQYETESIEKIYFQSDGGGWMKKGIDILGAESVLDEFHIRKYIRKMARLGGGTTEEDRKEAEETLLEWIKKGMGCPDRRSAYGKRRKAACRKLGIHKEKLEKCAQACAKRGRSDRQQHGEPYQSCAVSTDEFTADGLEPGRCRQAVTDKDILEEWKRHVKAGKATERKSDSRRS